MKHLFLALLSISILTSVRAQSAGDFKRTEDVIYGRKFGTALTLDVFQPVKTNGCAVLFMVSGGFFSSHEAINAAFFKAFLDRGYTVFAIVHGSQPKFTIPEIIQDIQRAVRFISSPCEQIRRGRRPNYRASAGGHLSLTMGTVGGPKADAKDTSSGKARAWLFHRPI